MKQPYNSTGTSSTGNTSVGRPRKDKDGSLRKKLNTRVAASTARFFQLETIRTGKSKGEIIDLLVAYYRNHSEIHLPDAPYE